MSADEADSLVGKIARVLDEVRDDLCGFDAEEMSSAVLPIVAVEVRKAKAEAWDECEATAIIEDAPCHENFLFMVTHAPNPYRETGSSDEYR